MNDAYDHPHGGILYPGCQIQHSFGILDFEKEAFLVRKKKVSF